MMTDPALSRTSIEPRDRLILALDVPTCTEARELVTRLAETVTFYKIGLELLMAGGYWELVEWLRSQGKQVFLDLKLFDVPQTVGSAVARLNDRGASFVTVHGNDSILAAACEAASAIKILAVTALTSLDQGDLDDLGFTCSAEELVLSRARRALELGCDGVVSSGLEVPRLRQELGSQLVVVTPGIRPVENRAIDDQKRVVTVEQAFAGGADYIVIGRPIRGADDPRAAAEQVQRQIARLFGGE